MVTPFKPGDKVTFEITETIYHPGHYRVALVKDRSELPAPPPVTPGTTDCGSAPIETSPVLPLLADGMLKHEEQFTGAQSFDVTLPSDVTCDKCTLQVIEFMANHSKPCFYYHCADISIKGDAAGGSGGGGGAGGSAGKPAGGAGGSANGGQNTGGQGGVLSTGGVGAPSSGGVNAGAGSPSSSGSSSGGATATGGAATTGGAPGSGGALSASGGALTTNGGALSASGAPGGGQVGSGPAPTEPAEGCGIGAGRGAQSSGLLASLGPLLLMGWLRRRRARALG